MKGIILAGGTGTRLKPLTEVTNKHLLPVYDRPMILYPIETLKQFGVSDILIVSGGQHIGAFVEFLGEGERYGVNLTYRVQSEPKGIAHALAVARDWVGKEDVFVLLGDNIFDPSIAKFQPSFKVQAGIWVKRISDAHRFGVLMDSGTIVEKPRSTTSGLAVTGLYRYPASVFSVIDTLAPSARGEYEITDVNNYYLEKGECEVQELPEDFFWSDAGTFESLAKASHWAQKQKSLGSGSSVDNHPRSFSGKVY